MSMRSPPTVGRRLLVVSYVTNNGTSNFGPEIFTLTNDGGTITVRQSMDGGATWHRGMAIDVASAPNNSVINLVGDGNIYGNVDVKPANDQRRERHDIFRRNHQPRIVPVGGFTTADLDTGISGEGTININRG